MENIEENNTCISGRPMAHSYITLISILETDIKARLLACISGIMIVTMAPVTMATEDSFC